MHWWIIKMNQKNNNNTPFIVKNHIYKNLMFTSAYLQNLFTQISLTNSHPRISFDSLFTHHISPTSHILSSSSQNEQNPHRKTERSPASSESAPGTRWLQRQSIRSLSGNLGLLLFRRGWLDWYRRMELPTMWNLQCISQLQSYELWNHRPVIRNEGLYQYAV